MPRPRTSIRPASAGAGRTSSRPCAASTSARSSATRRANGSSPCPAACSSATTSRDLPEPAGPWISTARAPTSTAEPWIDGLAITPSHRRQPHGEASAQHRWLVILRGGDGGAVLGDGGAVLGPQPALVGLDDLFGD